MHIGEYSFVNGKCIRHRMGAEHHLSEKDDDKRPKCLEDDDKYVLIVPFYLQFQLLEIIHRGKRYEHNDRKIYTPAKVNRFGTVPHAGHDPYEDQRKDRADRTFFRLGEYLIHYFGNATVPFRCHGREHKVLLEPFVERYMPSSPVFLDVTREIRPVEVLGKFYPEKS